MAGFALQGIAATASLAMLHGFLAAAAMTLLLYAAATVSFPDGPCGFRSFVVAAGSGVILNLNYHWKQLPLPKWLIVVHALAAVVGFVLLLWLRGREARAGA